VSLLVCTTSSESLAGKILSGFQRSWFV